MIRRPPRSTLSLHDALPICHRVVHPGRAAKEPDGRDFVLAARVGATTYLAASTKSRPSRSEEHTSELQSLAYLVCRLLLEKKKKTHRPHFLSTATDYRRPGR